MSAPQSIVQAAINRLGARLGSGLVETAAALAVLAQEAPERLRQEWSLFLEEVEAEAERLETDPAAGAASASGHGTRAAAAEAAAATAATAAWGTPQDQIDALRAQVAGLSRRLEDRP
jgi:hypothetical protein